MTRAGQATPAFVRLAAHPLRWQLLTELAAGDYRVRELVELVGQPQNLVSYHLRLLRGAELVTARRSSFDARDSYYHLDLDRCAHALTLTGAALHPALRLDAATPRKLAAEPSSRLRVLFTCTGNNARSPIAEALLRHRAGDAVHVTSAGSHPKEHLHKDTVRVLREDYAIDVAGQRPRHLDTMSWLGFDYVVSLCDKVREVCPEFPDHPRQVHWSIPDPAAAAEASGSSHAVFRRTAADIGTRIDHLVHALADAQPIEEVRP